MNKTLCIDLFCGLGGWTEGFLAEGYDVVGFDIERHVYGDAQYPAQLVLQDVLMIHGAQFKDATVIVASPPCQKYSWLAMPWSRSTTNHSQKAKALRRQWETEGPDNRLFDACFRIQREACEAAGRFIPLVVENVRGAQPWVGPAKWNYGSFYLWGDVPALMPSQRQLKNTGGSWFGIDGGNNPVSVRSDPRDVRRNENGEYGIKLPLGNAIGNPYSPSQRFSSRSHARKAASATIAKIPLPLSRHIARIYKPHE